MFSKHPFRSPPMPGPDVGWWRPLFAVLIALLVPAAFALYAVSTWAPTFAGPPKDGSSYSWSQNLAILVGLIGASPFASWVLAPFAVMALRLAAMTGWAGWGSAMLAALVMGLPAVHIVLHGDVTTEENAIPGHVSIAIAFLGLCVWAAFWGLMSRRQKSVAQ